MSRFPYMPLWIDAYLGATSHLSDAEHGRYIQLLLALWRAPDQRLPNDDKWLAHKFSRPIERVRGELRPLIREFCLADRKWITQSRINREFAFVAQKRRDNVKKAKSRWDKEKGACRSNAPTPTKISSSSSTFTDPARVAKPAFADRLAELAAKARMKASKE